MKTSIVSWENAHENDYVREVMENCGSSDIVDFFETDSEILYIDGKQVAFIEFTENNEVKAVVYLDGSYEVDEKEIVKRLERFYDENDNSYKGIDDTYENMQNLKNGVAYRGGQGYTYCLSEYN